MSTLFLASCPRASVWPGKVMEEPVVWDVASPLAICHRGAFPQTRGASIFGEGWALGGRVWAAHGLGIFSNETQRHPLWARSQWS